MATGATNLLGLALPVTGELSGTWGDEVNDKITKLLDSAIAGTTTLTADADVTLSSTTLAANQARQAIILWNVTGGTVTRNITAPAQSKIYIVVNRSTTQSIVFRGAGPTTGVTLIPEEKCVIAWDSGASDFVKVASNALSGNVSIIGSSSTGASLRLQEGTSNGGNYVSFKAPDAITSNVTWTLPGVDGSSNNVLVTNGAGVLSWASASSVSMVYPGAGIAVSTGSAWTTSKTAPTGDIVGTSDTQTLTNKTLTSPRIGTAINDTNGNELLLFTATASAVNEFTITNAINNNNPSISATGASTNISINLIPKGSGTVQANGVEVATISGTQTLTNKTLTSPRIGTSILDTNGNELFLLTATASAVNEITVANAATGNPASITATGEANAGMTISPSGTGRVTVNNLSVNNAYIEETYSASVSGTAAISLANGTVQFLTLGAATTVTLPTATAGSSFMLFIINGGTAYSVSWATSPSVKWPNGTAPPSPAINTRNKYIFTADGTNWWGSSGGIDMA